MIMELFAQVPTDSGMGWVAPVIQLVTAGGFGALVWYLVVKHIPLIEERHLNERTKEDEQHEKERAEWREYIERRDKTFEEISREQLLVIASLKQVIQDLMHELERLHK